MDLVTLSLARRHTNEKSIAPKTEHIFNNNTERDAYFAANPAEQVAGMYVMVGTQLQQWVDPDWVDRTQVIRGPKGDTGSQGPAGLQGIQGRDGAPMTPDDYGDLDEAKVAEIEALVAGTDDRYIFVVNPDGDNRLDDTVPAGIAGDMELHIIGYDPVGDEWHDYGQFTGTPGQPGPQGIQGEPGPAGGATTVDITSTLTTGGVTAGDVISAGTDLQAFATHLLVTVFNPTYVNPTASLSHNQSANMEAGSEPTVILTMTFNRGQIRGAIVGGLWDSNAVQNPRAGEATEYVIDGESTGTTNNRNVGAQTIDDGANTWSATVDYAEGPQPTNSVGDPVDSPRAPGDMTRTATITGRRRLFYGTDSVNDVAYTDSAEIRALSGNMLNPANGTSFTVNISAGDKMVVFAYPATLRDVDTVKFVEGMNAEIKGSFGLTTVEVEGANGYTGINYKVYTYIPAAPFGQTATYNVTI